MLGEKINATIEARYYFGAPVSKARGGLRPGIDWDNLSSLVQELDDLEYVERMKRGFGRAHQDVLVITDFVGRLHEAQRHFPDYVRSTSNILRDQRAIVDMTADAVRQIPTTPRAKLYAATDRV
jgi:hypothetical protein